MHDTQILQHNNPADIQANNSTLKEWSGEHGKQQTDIGSDLTPVTAFINGDTIPCNDSNSQNALEAWEYGGCVSYETSSSSISTFSRLGQHRKSTNTISAEFGSASNRPPSLDEPECERSGLIGDCKFLTSMAIGGGDVQCRKSGDNVDTETLCLSGEGHVGDSGQKHRRLAGQCTHCLHTNTMR